MLCLSKCFKSFFPLVFFTFLQFLTFFIIWLLQNTFYFFCWAIIISLLFFVAPELCEFIWLCVFWESEKYVCVFVCLCVCVCEYVSACVCERPRNRLSFFVSSNELKWLRVFVYEEEEVRETSICVRYENGRGGRVALFEQSEKWSVWDWVVKKVQNHSNSKLPPSTFITQWQQQFFFPAHNMTILLSVICWCIEN